MKAIRTDQAPLRERARNVVALFPKPQPWYEKMRAQ